MRTIAKRLQTCYYCSMAEKSTDKNKLKRETATVNIRIYPDTRAELSAQARREGKSMARVVAERVTPQKYAHTTFTTPESN